MPKLAARRHSARRRFARQFYNLFQIDLTRVPSKILAAFELISEVLIFFFIPVLSVCKKLKHNKCVWSRGARQPGGALPRF